MAEVEEQDIPAATGFRATAQGIEEVVVEVGDFTADVIYNQRSGSIWVAVLLLAIGVAIVYDLALLGFASLLFLALREGARS